ncbi:unnamed protein product [Parnassius mnemosyne]|uniref:Uncharacterized protein n=1 Tax=Parnassius mnemosyne TaxID=213953 RepID=A0AAV1KLJ3_9NEOP
MLCVTPVPQQPSPIAFESLVSPITTTLRARPSADPATTSSDIIPALRRATRNACLVGKATTARNLSAKRDVTQRMVAAIDPVIAIVDLDGAENCVLNVNRTQVVSMATATDRHGIVPVIPTGEEFFVIKISTTVEHMNHVNMAALVRIRHQINTFAPVPKVSPVWTANV